jgi:hypothetical protein
MHQLIACVICGGLDPNADSLLLQAAIAGGLTAPWMLRAKLLALVARVRGRAPDSGSEEACPLPHPDDMEPPADR